MPLVARKSGARAYFIADGPDVEPPEWYRPAPPFQRPMPPTRRDRRRYYATLAVELYNRKVKELSEGLDGQGIPLAPVKLPRRGRSDWHRREYRKGKGPPLMPFLRDSRTRNLLRYRSSEREAAVYWAAVKAPGAKLTWAEIVIAHAEGRVRGAPIRDVIGISPRGAAAAVGAAISRYRRGLGPRKVELPGTTRHDAKPRAAKKPEPGGDPFNIRFRKVSVIDRIRSTVMRFFRRQGPPKPDAGIPSIAPAGEARAYRRGDRWLVVRGDRAWVVGADGSARRRSLAGRAVKPGWTPVSPLDPAIPPAVRRLMRG